MTPVTNLFMYDHKAWIFWLNTEKKIKMDARRNELSFCKVSGKYSDK